MYENKGKPYTKASLIRIKNLAKKGVSISRIASIMQRPVGGISLILRECRRMEMLQNGNDNDTLISWKKRNK